MEVRFVTRNVELPADVKDYMVKKVSKIEKFFDRILGTQIALNFKRGMNVVEITSNVNGVVMRGEEYAPDLRKARWQGIRSASGLRPTAVPTARVARGAPIRAASAE